MVGRPTASQIASASAASFLLRFTYAFTYCAGISRTSCPSAPSSRAQYWAVAHASSPTTQRGSWLKKPQLGTSMPQGGHPPPSLDHLVGERKEFVWNGEPQCL